MPLYPIQTVRPPLLTIRPTANSTGTSVATHGAAISPTVSGNFTITDRTSVKITVSIPFASNSTASTAVDCHTLVNGVCVQESTAIAYGAGNGWGITQVFQVDGLPTGANSIALQMKVTSGTGSFRFVSANATAAPGFVEVVEV